MNSDFFQEQRDQSLIKARIVSKYFSAWANVILATQKRYPQHAQKMAYIDLFAGPGRYDDLIHSSFMPQSSFPTHAHSVITFSVFVVSTERQSFQS